MAKPNCSKCGDLKSGSYRAESWCGKCVGERRRKLRNERRQEKGLPPYGSGRDPNCKDCRQPKEDSYKNGNYCGKCKCAREKTRYEKTRQLLGKPPRRMGRNPLCNCGVKKENISESECRKCTNQRKRLLRIKNKSDPSWVILEREKNISRFRDNIENQKKRTCRRATKRMIDKGILKYQPCEKCGDKNVQVHHEDYDDPLNIKWLCSCHHAELHKNSKIRDNSLNN